MTEIWLRRGATTHVGAELAFRVDPQHRRRHSCNSPLRGDGRAHDETAVPAVVPEALGAHREAWVLNGRAPVEVHGTDASEGADSQLHYYRAEGNRRAQVCRLPRSLALLATMAISTLHTV